MGEILKKLRFDNSGKFFFMGGYKLGKPDYLAIEK
jgi:hypothetical protein